MGRHRLSPLTVVVLAFLTAVGPRAADRDPGPLVTDRPDVTESSEVVPRGFVQIEAGYNFIRFDHDDETVEFSSIPATLVRVGIAPTVELRLEWFGYVSESREAGAVRTDDSGAGNTALGAKIKLREEAGAAPQMALLLDAVLPSGDVAIRGDRIDPTARVAFGHTLSERIGLSYNLGVAALTLEDDAGDVATHGLGRYSVALGIGITEKWGSFVEAFGLIPISGPEAPANLVDVGFTYLATDSMQLDFSGGLGLNDHADDWFMGAGFSVRLPR